MSLDIYLNVTAWMDKCAEAIASMPFRKDSYEHDIAVQIAKHAPHNSNFLKWKELPKPQRPPMRQVDGYDSNQRARVAAGLCFRCGEPAVERWGRKLRVCEVHREMDRKRSAYVRKSR